MNGLALLLTAAAMAVDYSWHKTDTGQVEYLVRIEAEVVPALLAGEEIHSDVPADAGVVERFRLRMGIEGTASAVRVAPTYNAQTPAGATLFTRAGSLPVATTDVSYGYQPNADGTLQYFVQLAPSLLQQMGKGDEIEAPVDITVGRVTNFVVLAGNKQLPRVPASGTTPAPLETAGKPPFRSGPPATLPTDNGRFAGPPAANPAADLSSGSRFNGGGVGPTAATEPRADRFGTPTDSSTTSATGSARFNDRFNDRSSSGGGTPAPVDDRSAGFNSRFNNNGYDSANSGAAATNPLANYGANAQPPAASQSGSDLYPPPASNRNFSSSQPTLNDGGRSRQPLAPPPAVAPPANLRPLEQAGQQTGYETAATADRVATADNFTQRPTSAPTAPNVVTRSETRDEDRPWMPFVMTFCALCLSIGGNVYLGWTAMEFYHRYRAAVERVRSGGSRS